MNKPWMKQDGIRMIDKNHQQTRAVIVLHEIYGINEHMTTTCQAIHEHGFDVFCPNLTKREMPFSYSQEAAAYQHFMEDVGFELALWQVTHWLAEIRDSYQKIVVVGFSVGATVAWLTSELEGVDGVVGYYGSRIRDYLDIMPKCPVLLFFPKAEPSFNVDQLITALAHPHLTAHKSNALHGFSNRYSPHYHQPSAEHAFNELLLFLLSE